MPKQVEELKLVLLRNQGTFGTIETTPVAGDVLEVEAGASLKLDPRVKEIALIGGGFTQNASVIGPREAAVSFSLPLRTGGVEGTPGQIDQVLKSMGFVRADSDTDADTTDDRFIYTLTSDSSEWVDSTIWGYSGNLASGASLLTILQNCLFTGKISIDFVNATAMLSADGKGLLSAVPSLDTQPSVTPSTVLVSTVQGITWSFFGDANYIPTMLEIDLGTDVTVTLDPSQTHGLGVSQFTKRKITWNAKVYHDSAVIPATPLFAKTLGTISAAWGTAPNAFTVSSTKAQITNINDSDQDGVTVYELSGILVDNDLSIQIDTAET